MKKLSFILTFFVAFVFSACKTTVDEFVTYKINEPVLMTKSSFRSSVKYNKQPVEINNLGKLCFYDGYLFISEPEKGIHIIDNRQPAQPVNIGFIELMGNADLAIRDGLLYADSYIDLVWFDISNPENPTLKGRAKDIFPSAIPMVANQYGYDYGNVYYGNTDSIVVGWNLVERTEEVKNYNPGWWWGWRNGGMVDDMLMTSVETGSTKSTGNGINGSMSRFTIYDNKLYAVINNALTVFDVSGTEPTQKYSTYIGFNVETIFSYKDNLFMGTPTGMLIYSVTDPLKPEYQSRISHAYGCDPVVVDNDLAYVTVHSGNACGQTLNELIIIDVKDVKLPKQIVSYTMTNPKGLGIDAGKLFLCDDGLKIYQLTDSPNQLMSNQITHIKGMDGFDLIPYGNTLMMIADDGLYQYDYTNTSNIRLLSKIGFVKN